MKEITLACEAFQKLLEEQLDDADRAKITLNERFM